MKALHIVVKRTSSIKKAGEDMSSLQIRINKSINRMGRVHPVIKETAIEIIKRADREGINVLITDGYRSMEEQAKLYGKGRKSYVYKGKDYGDPSSAIVTNAKPGSSNHNFGLAIDYALSNADATEVYYTVNQSYKRVAAIAKSLGFAWGGDWTSFNDYPHLEMTGGLTFRELQNGKTPDLSLRFTPEKGSGQKPAEPIKESIGMYKPSNTEFMNATARVLRRLENKEMHGDQAIDPVHREKLLKGELSLDDTIALLYVAFDRGLIRGTN